MSIINENINTAMKRIIYNFLIGIVAVSCTTGNSAEAPSAKNDASIHVKVIETKTSTNETAELNYSGIAEPTVTIPLSFELPGKVVWLQAEEGTLVKKGQALAKLDKTTFQSAYNAALASQKQAQDAYERVKIVYENGSLPEIKWEDVKTKLEQANSAEAIAKENLSKCILISPMNGVISSKNIEIGSNATPGITVIKVISTGDIDVKISVPDNEINRIKIGQQAAVVFSSLGNKSYEATVEKVAVSANTISKTFEVKLRIANDDQQIKPGMTCEVNLNLQEQEAGLLIPIQSVMKDENNTNYVFTVDKQRNEAVRKDIKTSGILNNQLCVTDGLTAGEILVVEGQHKLTDHAKVRIN